MTRKDCVRIGTFLKPLTRDIVTANAMPTVLDALCRAFAADNPQFKSGRFVGFVNGSCGPSGGRVHEREYQG